MKRKLTNQERTEISSKCSKITELNQKLIAENSETSNLEIMVLINSLNAVIIQFGEILGKK